jgi:hypothetical protein
MGSCKSQIVCGATFFGDAWVSWIKIGRLELFAMMIAARALFLYRGFEAIHNNLPSPSCRDNFLAKLMRED